MLNSHASLLPLRCLRCSPPMKVTGLVLLKCVDDRRLASVGCETLCCYDDASSLVSMVFALLASLENFVGRVWVSRKKPNSSPLLILLEASLLSTVVSGKALLATCLCSEVLAMMPCVF